MPDLKTIADGMRKECREDEVGLWELVHAVRNTLQQSDPRCAVLEIVRQLLLDTDIKAGTWDTSGQWRFRIWACPTQEIVERISDQWEKLDRDPGPGDIVYFTCPALRELLTE